MDAVLLPYKGKDMPKISVRPLGSTALITTLQMSHGKGVDFIVLQHRPPVETTFGDFRTDAEAALVRLDRNGVVRSASFSGGSFLSRASGQTLASRPRPSRQERKIAVRSHDAHQVRLSWASPKTVRPCVEYGHAGGGGYIFRTPLPEKVAAHCSVEIAGMSYDLDYVYRAIEVTDKGEAIVGEGTFEIPLPKDFDFDCGGHQGWPKRGANGCVLAQPGYGGTKFCLKRAARPMREVHYIHADHATRLAVGENTRVSFAYKTDVSEPIKDFYFKITLTDTERRWWAVYLERKPSPEWRHVNLRLTDFRGDGPRKVNAGQTLAQATKIIKLGFTMRKGATERPAAHSFSVDQIMCVE